MLELRTPPSYRVATTFTPMAPALTRFSPRFAITLGGTLVLGFIVIRLISGAIYAEETRSLPTVETEVLSVYQPTVKKMTDVEKVLKSADRLVLKGYYPFAALLYEQASNLDPNLRDASYGWAYSLLQKPQVTASDLVAIHSAIARAEAVDPLYAPLLQVKLIVANLEKDTATLAATRARLDSLKF